MVEEGMSAHLTAEQLASYLDGRLTPTEHDRVLAHFDRCAECRREMTASRGVIGHAQPAGMESFARRTLVPALVGLAAVLAIAVASPMLRDLRAPDPAVRAPVGLVESDIVAQMATVSPGDDGSFLGEPGVFVWRAASADAEYHLTVTDATGGIVWLKRTTDTSVVVPGDLRLPRGKDYFWSVDALLGDGRSATTRVHRFSIR
jgi:anti-sigma factor RsiW